MTDNVETKILIGGDQSGAEKAIKQTVTALESLHRDVNKPLGKIAAVEELRAGLDSLTSGVIKSTAELERERAQLAKLEAELRKAGIDTDNLADEKKRLEATSISAARGVSELKGRLAELQGAAKPAADRTREAGAAAEKAGHQGDSGASGIGSMANALKALAAAAVVREFIQANASMESMAKSLEQVTGSSEAAAQEMEFVRNEATRLGLEVNAAANSYVQLAASAKGTTLQGQAARDIWSAVAESMARLGKSTADTDGALLAISQMMSKGTVSAEELRGQLGERLPGAFQAAARAMNTTTQGLGEMLEQGQVIAAEFLPKFADELRKAGGDGGEVDTFNANMNRLKNTLSEVYLSLGETGAFEAMSGGLKVVSVGAIAAWETFELLGKTLANIAYTISSLDFSGYRDRQREALEEARADVSKVIERLYPLQAGLNDAGTAGQQAGKDIAGGMQQGAQGVNLATNAVKQLDADLKALGVDPEQFLSGMATAEKGMVAAFDRIVASGKYAGDAILVGFANGIQQVGGEALDQFEVAIQDAFQKGVVSAEQLDAALQMLEVRHKELTAGAGELEAAYKTLGITSQEELKKTAAGMKTAYDALVRLGAPLADQNAAWARYAEAAIAANGGVADSTIQADAYMRGYIITVDEAGKAVLRLKSVTHDWSETVRQATYAANLALTEHAQQLSQLYDATSGGIGSLQGSIDDFHAHLQGLGDAMAYHINLTRQAVFDATKGSEEAMKRFNELAVGGANQTHWIGDAIAAYYRAMKTVIDGYNTQMEAADKLLARIRAATQEGAKLSDAALSGAFNFSLLDEQTLANLRAGIDAAHRQLQNFGDQARTTVEGLREQLAEMRGEYAAVEKARGDSEILELRAKLKEAQDALRRMTGIGGQIQGDPETVKALQDGIRDLQESIRLQEEINRLREQEAKAREDSFRQKQSGNTGGTAPTTTGGSAPGTSGPSPIRIDLSLNGKPQGYVNVVEPRDVNSLEGFLVQLKADMARAQ